jgi:hypothetical protein
MKGNYDNSDSDRYNSGAPKGARLVFGIFMILVYLGVGLLFIFNVFDLWSKALSIVMGAILCAYGVWRGYRLYKGYN